jgi:hypothetical protein
MRSTSRNALTSKPALPGVAYCGNGKEEVFLIFTTMKRCLQNKEKDR